jgi:hypothetical protein
MIFFVVVVVVVVCGATTLRRHGVVCHEELANRGADAPLQLDGPAHVAPLGDRDELLREEDAAHLALVLLEEELRERVGARLRAERDLARRALARQHAVERRVRAELHAVGVRRRPRADVGDKSEGQATAQHVSAGLFVLKWCCKFVRRSCV